MVLELWEFWGGVGYQRFRDEDFEERVREGVFDDNGVRGCLYRVCGGEVVEFDHPLFVISYDDALAYDENLFLFGKREDGANSLFKDRLSDVKRETTERRVLRSRNLDVQCI